MFEWFINLFNKEKPMKQMIDDETCIQRLLVNEGLRTRAYRCPTGFLTIGIGRNLDTNPLTKEELAYVGHNCRNKFISNDQAFYLCRNDLKKVRADLDRELPWWRDLSTDRQFVMIDLCFNLGVGKLLGFKRTLQSIATGYYVRAGEQLLQSKYAKQVGNRAKRNAECLQTGIYK